MIFIVFPDQLYKDTKLLKNKNVILIEDSLYFHDSKLRPYKYSKIKLAYMRASMKFYEAYLKSKGINVTYYDFDKQNQLKLTNKYEMYTPNDLLIKVKYNKAAKLHDYNPNFILTVEECLEIKSKRHSGFYNQMKKKLNILTDTPNLDKMNRKTMSSKDADSFTEGKQPTYKSTFHNEAIQYIEKHFPNNPGILDINTLKLYPCSFNDAERHLNYFIDNKLKHFGDLQDYIHDQSTFMYHSNISCILNNGLITPRQVIDRTMTKHQHIPINSLEGFIRQVIGWREYMRYIYFVECNDYNVDNKWNAQNKLTWPKSGNHPVNIEIEKINKYAYAHHIVRLMVILNWLVLNKVKPQYVIQWFSEMFIDAFPWNMYSNILTMGYYNRNYTHKSYLTSSNYILKMSNYKKGEWSEEWDKVRKMI